MAIKVVTLDQQIRAKAKQDATFRFNNARTALLQDGHSGTWEMGFPHAKFVELRTLLDEFLDKIVIPMAEQKAINQFHATYEVLLNEYPDLIQESEEERHD